MQSSGWSKANRTAFPAAGHLERYIHLLAKRHGKGSIASTMHFRVLVVGDRLGEAKGVLTGAGIKFVEKDRVGGVIVLSQLEFRVAHDHFAIFVMRSSFPTCITIFISSLAAMSASRLDTFESPRLDAGDAIGGATSFVVRMVES
jgi:hypothetical protein